MCTGGRLLADFVVGTFERPEVPDVVGDCLTTTVDGAWVVWAHKVARPHGDMFRPLAGGEPYPVDAVATCRKDEDLVRPHEAPDRECSCGFHALSHPWLIQSAGVARIEVALSGRILAFEWPQAGVLFRAARQTVMRIDAAFGPPRPDRCTRPPLAGWATGGHKGDDPDGRLALRRGEDPTGAGPVCLPVPRTAVMRFTM